MHPREIIPSRIKSQRFAIRLSLIVGLLMLVGKWYGFALTDSASIFSDAAESVVHVCAVAFAAFSMRLSHRPADDRHPFGHEKIVYFSAGVEGGLIMLAAGFIVYEAVSKLLFGVTIKNVDSGMLIVLAASVLNLGLGTFLVWRGKKTDSLILIANGKHVLTDSWTSFGVVAGLVLVLVTGWLLWDPIVAIIVAINILVTGAKLVRKAVGGLMDEADPDLNLRIRSVLDRETAARKLRYHELHVRRSGNSVWIEYHLLFQSGVALDEAHKTATEIETTLAGSLDVFSHINSHLEPAETHDVHHRATS